jgi:hypothetical protein
MNRKDIEEAISYYGLPRGRQMDRLVKVAEAWIKLEEWLTPKPQSNPLSPFSGTNSHMVDVYILLNKMQEFLNPKPKTDIQRVREWVKEQTTPGHGYRFYAAGYEQLMAFLDQLEKEKEPPTP